MRAPLPRWAPPDLSVEVRHNQEQHRFEMDLGGSTAVAVYNSLSQAIMFTHTEVPPQHEGKGIGTMLIEAGLAYARDQELMVIPICPFFAAYMKRHSDVHDLLDADQRRILHIA